MNTPKDLYYSREHEWLKIEGETVIIGITDYAQEELGEVVYVDLPEIEQEFSKDESFGEIESVKAASDIYTPVSIKILEINDELEESPELINESPYEKAWIIKGELKNKDEIKTLMNSEDYEKFIEELE
jgi:glycine cleavage system H protein